MTDSPTRLGSAPGATTYAADAPRAAATDDVLARLALPRDRRDARRPSRRVVLRSLDVVKGLVLGTVVSIGAAAHVQAEPATPPAATAPQVDRALQQLMTDHRCTTTGFPDGAIPASTLLRSPDGHLRVVSFARGWAAHEGTAPGELVAVCLGPSERAR